MDSVGGTSPCLSATWFCVVSTFPPKLSNLKKYIYISSCSFLRVRSSGAAQLSRVAVAQSLVTSPSHRPDLQSPGGPTTCILSGSLAAVGRKLESLGLWPSSQGRPGVLTTGRRASPGRVNRGRERAQHGSRDVPRDRVSDVVRHHVFVSKKQVTESCSCSRGGELDCTF